MKSKEEFHHFLLSFTIGLMKLKLREKYTQNKKNENRKITHANNSEQDLL